MDAHFEHLCRVCAANTKSKTNSVVESVFIFKTSGLKEKISRHLFLNVAEDDPLPKVLCKSCYRQVEATASLSNIAKHTQRVFCDFLLSTVPKHAREATAALLPSPPVASTSAHNIRESRQSESSNTARNTISLENDTFQPIRLTRPPETTITLAQQQEKSSQAHNDVAVNSNNNDNKTGSQQQKLQNISSTETAQYNRNRSIVKTSFVLPPRRNSVFVDTRYSSTPMSIAQRSMQQPPSLMPLHPEMSVTKTLKSSPEKKNSPAGVINFIQTHGRITGSAPSIAPRINKNYTDEETSKSIHTKNQIDACSTAQTVNNVGVSNLPTSVLQQKRRNLKNALSNISAIRDGQVSLLKSAHERQSVENIDIRPLVTTTVVPHLSLYGSEPSVEEALPEHIIIAAPKKKKEESHSHSRQCIPQSQKIITAPTKSTQKSTDATSQNFAKSKTPPNMSSLTDAISLGNVIRDPDLLMLILKALKWPVTSGNCEDQMTKLKNSKFAVIMSDSNLLQDTDLTQLLGPYLGPMMNVIQQQQKQPSTTNVSSPSPSESPTQATSELQSIGDCTMYKLPPETSVQLVPSSPTDKESPQLVSNKALGTNAKRLQRKPRAREFLGDGQQNTSAPETSNAAVVTNELLNINAMLISQFGSNPADAINEALVSMLNQQQDSKNQRQTRRSRSVSTTTTPLNLEDIILVEPQTSLESVSTNDEVTFKIPPRKLVELPIITRPVIKRRKAVMKMSEKISSSKECNNETRIDKSHGDNTTKTELEKCKDKQITPLVPSKTDSNSGAQHVIDMQQAPTSTVPEINSSEIINHIDFECTTDIGATTNKSCADKPAIPSVRKTDVKAALGQKLLEAIGLPQTGKNVTPECSRNTLRSALKRSLKQAQEQQQHLKRVKLEEPVKQMADSTTKPGAGESSEEHKKAIAERELELLKRKSKNAEKKTVWQSRSNEKSERMDVSSSSSRNRRIRNKSKTDAHEDDSGIEAKKSERWDEDDDLPLKTEVEKPTEYINRPKRTSKTVSKYYKSPGIDKALSVQKSQHAMGTRSTRQR
ncbi:LOW QUALITY PROTEIN: uncharacterized protein LOC132798189 [Drosophila nasuta]|uniref:LOW QUALITY PROTEIN: uncharacterized protein LOC132798189 n=1 Tax=Drosophila nasuta TaxID=42062 RepID=UPI00295E2832|nr:LOW QUALITY PROTEIN: uncharacterized protein LOC132798189 [Drosophila nasuta]